ncbi:hypothetical protein D9758_017320 [Tetrapyrgos nigripes]|uniref:FMN hydroxy acid dehydrogenase domain-containing protein n=1 Tax=Tetrapyrgos nigripes TaxID=182062 RepID=A0A8H5BUB1_9AGAR|nr:hypothetical protein D9758_017320 [Tetrapyrgos nigripes]
MSTTLFGVRYPSPNILAPFGIQGTFCPDSEPAPARAAEAVAKINEEFAALNLEEPAIGNFSLVADLQSPILVPNEINSTGQALAPRTKKAGDTVLVVTLDTMSLDWRLHDLERCYPPFALGVGVERVSPPTSGPFSTNLWVERDGGATRQSTGRRVVWLANAGLYKSSQDLDFILSEWERQVVLKGIQSVSGAEKAADLLRGRGREGGIVITSHVSEVLQSVWHEFGEAEDFFRYVNFSWLDLHLFPCFPSFVPFPEL